MRSDIDIIVPTFNSEAVISLTLSAIYQQFIPDPWECRVIISDDGSTDRTLEEVERIKPPPAWSDPLILSNRHGGAAEARNQGLAVKGATIILLLGADIILQPRALSAHLNFHQDHPDPIRAALGFVKWDPAINPTPLMEWMIHGGTQNNFDDLLGKHEADPSHFFYGSHLSAKRSFLQSSKFATIYQGYGWEDLDLGRRLKTRGLKLVVLHQAVGLHHHFYTASQIFSRQVEVGRNLAIYQKQHPSEDLLPHRSLRSKIIHTLCYYLGILSLLMFIVSKTSLRTSAPRIFGFLMSALLYRGLNKAKNEKRRTK